MKDPHTIASSIGVASPLDGHKALQSIKESGGFAEEVGDKNILKAMDLLARKEGIFAEPGGAASLAGLLKAKGKIERGSRVVCVVTGHGLKTPFIRAGKRKGLNMLKNKNIRKTGDDSTAWRNSEG
jgi:threonine synthase